MRASIGPAGPGIVVSSTSATGRSTGGSTGADLDTAAAGDAGVVVDEQRRFAVVVHGLQHLGNSVVEHGTSHFRVGRGRIPGGPPVTMAAPEAVSDVFGLAQLGQGGA